MASCPAFLSSPLSLERPACVRELIAAVGDAATFSVAGRSVVLQQGYDNSAYSLVLPSCCGRVAAYCSMIGALHFRRGRRFARAASSLLLLLLAYGACFGRATMLGRVHRTRQHLVLESPSGTITSSTSMLQWHHRRHHRRRRPRATYSPGLDLQCRLPTRQLRCAASCTCFLLSCCLVSSSLEYFCKRVVA